ncbi:MAG TPA: hypothetical protein VFZ25_10540 [Chloroflexota bacterium]|nr:hypothetical protein [Chloroflexota bacterium]
MNQRDCTEPGAVSPEDLLAFLDGDAPRRVVDHLNRCAYCSASARSYRDTQRGLRRILDRVECPSPQILGEYELNLVSPTERQRIAGHVLGCDRCADELRRLREFMAGGLRPVRPDGLPERIRRIVANLVPPAASPAFAGLRGTSDEVARVYQAGNLLLALEWRPDVRPGRFTLVGLAMPEAAADASAEPDLADRPVHLIAGPGPALVERTDELGNFQFADLAPGAYRLELDLDGEVVVVEDLLAQY